jgi:hypothetical protein
LSVRVDSGKCSSVTRDTDGSPEVANSSSPFGTVSFHCDRLPFGNRPVSSITFRGNQSSRIVDVSGDVLPAVFTNPDLMLLTISVNGPAEEAIGLEHDILRRAQGVFVVVPDFRVNIQGFNRVED